MSTSRLSESTQVSEFIATTSHIVSEKIIFAIQLLGAIPNYSFDETQNYMNLAENALILWSEFYQKKDFTPANYQDIHKRCDALIKELLLSEDENTQKIVRTCVGGLYYMAGMCEFALNNYTVAKRKLNEGLFICPDDQIRDVLATSHAHVSLTIETIEGHYQLSTLMRFEQDEVLSELNNSATNKSYIEELSKYINLMRAPVVDYLSQFKDIERIKQTINDLYTQWSKSFFEEGNLLDIKKHTDALLNSNDLAFLSKQEKLTFFSHLLHDDLALYSEDQENSSLANMFIKHLQLAEQYCGLVDVGIELLRLIEEDEEELEHRYYKSYQQLLELVEKNTAMSSVYLNLEMENNLSEFFDEDSVEYPVLALSTSNLKFITQVKSTGIQLGIFKRETILSSDDSITIEFKNICNRFLEIISFDISEYHLLQIECGLFIEKHILVNKPIDEILKQYGEILTKLYLISGICETARLGGELNNDANDSSDTVKLFGINYSNGLYIGEQLTLDPKLLNLLHFCYAYHHLHNNNVISGKYHLDLVDNHCAEISVLKNPIMNDVESYLKNNPDINIIAAKDADHAIQKMKDLVKNPDYNSVQIISKEYNNENGKEVTKEQDSEFYFWKSICYFKLHYKAVTNDNPVSGSTLVESIKDSFCFSLNIVSTLFRYIKTLREEYPHDKMGGHIKLFIKQYDFLIKQNIGAAQQIDNLQILNNIVDISSCYFGSNLFEYSLTEFSFSRASKPMTIGIPSSDNLSDDEEQVDSQDDYVLIGSKMNVETFISVSTKYIQKPFLIKLKEFSKGEASNDIAHTCISLLNEFFSIKGVIVGKYLSIKGRAITLVNGLVKKSEELKLAGMNNEFQQLHKLMTLASLMYYIIGTCELAVGSIYSAQQYFKKGKDIPASDEIIVPFILAHAYSALCQKNGVDNLIHLFSKEGLSEQRTSWFIENNEFANSVWRTIKDTTTTNLVDLTKNVSQVEKIAGLKTLAKPYLDSVTNHFNELDDKIIEEFKEIKKKFLEIDKLDDILYAEVMERAEQLVCNILKNKCDENGDVAGVRQATTCALYFILGICELVSVINLQNEKPSNNEMESVNAVDMYLTTSLVLCTEESFKDVIYLVRSDNELLQQKYLKAYKNLWSIQVINTSELLNKAKIINLAKIDAFIGAQITTPENKDVSKLLPKLDKAVATNDHQSVVSIIAKIEKQKSISVDQIFQMIVCELIHGLRSIARGKAAWSSNINEYIKRKLLFIINNSSNATIGLIEILKMFSGIDLNFAALNSLSTACQEIIKDEQGNISSYFLNKLSCALKQANDLAAQSAAVVTNSSSMEKTKSENEQTQVKNNDNPIDENALAEQKRQKEKAEEEEKQRKAEAIAAENRRKAQQEEAEKLEVEKMLEQQRKQRELAEANRLKQLQPKNKDKKKAKREAYSVVEDEGEVEVVNTTTKKQKREAKKKSKPVIGKELKKLETLEDSKPAKSASSPIPTVNEVDENAQKRQKEKAEKEEKQRKAEAVEAENRRKAQQEEAEKLEVDNKKVKREACSVVEDEVENVIVEKKPKKKAKKKAKKKSKPVVVKKLEKWEILEDSAPAKPSPYPIPSVNENEYDLPAYIAWKESLIAHKEQFLFQFFSQDEVNELKMIIDYLTENGSELVFNGSIVEEWSLLDVTENIDLSKSRKLKNDIDICIKNTAKADEFKDFLLSDNFKFLKFKVNNNNTNTFVIKLEVIRRDTKEAENGHELNLDISIRKRNYVPNSYNRWTSGEFVVDLSNPKVPNIHLRCTREYYDAYKTLRLEITLPNANLSNYSYQLFKTQVACNNIIREIDNGDNIYPALYKLFVELLKNSNEKNKRYVYMDMLAFVKHEKFDHAVVHKFLRVAFRALVVTHCDYRQSSDNQLNKTKLDDLICNLTNYAISLFVKDKNYFNKDLAIFIKQINSLVSFYVNLEANQAMQLSHLISQQLINNMHPEAQKKVREFFGSVVTYRATEVNPETAAEMTGALIKLVREKLFLFNNPQTRYAQALHFIATCFDSLELPELKKRSNSNFSPTLFLQPPIKPETVTKTDDQQQSPPVILLRKKE